jgi:hypothetical protein
MPVTPQTTIADMSGPGLKLVCRPSYDRLDGYDLDGRTSR